jgi:DNA-binding MarR family transcriptional regulator
MSVTISSACWQIEGITPTQKLVLVALADQANDDGVCWPSIKTIQRRTCLTDRAVQKSIAGLIQAGYLVRDSRYGRSSYFTVTPEPRSPRTTFTPELDSPPPPNVVHHPPEPRSPRTVIEPSVEPKPPKLAGKRKAAQPSTLPNWIASLVNEDAIPSDDPIVREMDAAGIPILFQALYWQTFKADMTERGKRQKDWRAHFRNAVRRNWYKLWYFDGQGQCRLTTAGEQAMRTVGHE